MPETTVAAIIRKGEPQNYKILLTQRKKPPFSQMFCLPGGHIEPFEHSKTAVIREVFEETGLNFRNPTFIGKHEEMYRDTNTHNISLFYIGDAEGTITIQQDEVLDFKWITINEAKNFELAFDHHLALARLLIENTSIPERLTTNIISDLCKVPEFHSHIKMANKDWICCPYCTVPI